MPSDCLRLVEQFRLTITTHVPESYQRITFLFTPAVDSCRTAAGIILPAKNFSETIMENVIIIGTGCAGYTAAIYTARANLNPLLISGTQIGGQLSTTTDVENFPGFPEGIMGPEMMMNMQKQAEKFGTRIEYATVELIEKNEDGTFSVKLGEKTLQTKTVIIATGAAARWLGLPNEKELSDTDSLPARLATARSTEMCQWPLSAVAIARARRRASSPASRARCI